MIVQKKCDKSTHHYLLSNDLELQTNTVLFPDKFEKMHKLQFSELKLTR